MTGSSSSRTYDVAIVGSGPAGSAAAYVLADQGVRTVVIEKEHLPRYKVCGGGVVRRAVDALPVDIRQIVEREFLSVQMNFLDAGLQFSSNRSRSIVSMTMRDKIDHLLVLSAQDRSAEIVSECKVEDISWRPDTIELTTCKGTIAARFVIAADGASGVVARRAGWKDHRMRAPALEYEITVPPTVQETLSQTLRFDFGVVPRGYGWVFPKREHLSIGIGALSPRRSLLGLKQMLAQYLTSLGIHHITHMARHGFVIPVMPRPGPLVRNRVVLVGDAAGLADPVTGEGITNAILSGQAAANAIIQSDFSDDRVRQNYHAAINTTILRELRAARLLASMLYGFSQFRNFMFARHGRSFAETVTDVFMGEKSYHQEVYNPANYLKLLRLRRSRFADSVT
jgi:geranylgeranyl reductase family protein